MANIGEETGETFVHYSNNYGTFRTLLNESGMELRQQSRELQNGVGHGLRDLPVSLQGKH
jgi:hypothetical protein